MSIIIGCNYSPPQITHRHQSEVYRLGVESDHEAELTINITIAGVRWGRVYK